VTVPFWISYLLRIFSWNVVLGFGGALNSGLIALGLIERPIEALLYNQFAVILALAHSWSAFAVLPIYVSLQKIDPHLLEAALDLGDSSILRFRRVVLPLRHAGSPGGIPSRVRATMGRLHHAALVGGTEGTMVGNAIATLYGKQNDAPLGAALSSQHGVRRAAVGLTVRRSTERLSGGRAHDARGLGLYAAAYLAFLYAPLCSFRCSRSTTAASSPFPTAWRDVEMVREMAPMHSVACPLEQHSRRGSRGDRLDRLGLMARSPWGVIRCGSRRRFWAAHGAAGRPDIGAWGIAADPHPRDLGAELLTLDGRDWPLPLVPALFGGDPAGAPGRVRPKLERLSMDLGHSGLARFGA
jgi:hypothetical protein